MPAHGEGDLQLRADAIDAGDQHRVAQALEVGGEETAEAADLAEHLGPMSALYPRLDAALDQIAEININARLRVGLFLLFVRRFHRFSRSEEHTSELQSR